MVVEREVSYMQENCKHVKDTSLGVGDMIVNYRY